MNTRVHTYLTEHLSRVCMDERSKSSESRFDKLVIPSFIHLQDVSRGYVETTNNRSTQ